MSSAIQLDDQFSTEAVEIYNVVINAFLSLKTNGILF